MTEKLTGKFPQNKFIQLLHSLRLLFPAVFLLHLLKKGQRAFQTGAVIKIPQLLRKQPGISVEKFTYESELEVQIDGFCQVVNLAPLFAAAETAVLPLFH